MVEAQGPDDTWTDFENISGTPTSSTYPCIATDAAGNVHVLWSEDVGGETENLEYNQDGTPKLDRRGNQVNCLTAPGNTLYYTRWDGERWLPPIDIYIAPLGHAEYPAAGVDQQGILHVVWVGGTITRQVQLHYSRAPVAKAMSAREWTKPFVLAEPVLMGCYTTDIAVDQTGGLHVLYSQLGTEPGAYVINSFDGGRTWSRPMLLYPTYDPYGEQEGVSTMKVIADRTGRLHATWTRYNRDGNGEAILYTQSVDLGQTWSEPLEVAVHQPGWYETDWLNVAAVGDEVHLVWEGGEQAFLNERVSRDGGLTWNEPRRILPSLVGENGWADLVVDSANQLHLLVVMRFAANQEIHGVWYSRWENDHWRDPVLLSMSSQRFHALTGRDHRASTEELLKNTFTDLGVRYQKSAIIEGNKLFVIVVNEWGGDIWSSHTALPAPHIPPQPYPEPTATLAPTATSQLVHTPVPARSTPVFASVPPFYNVSQNPGTEVLVGVAPSFLIVAAVVLIQRLRSRI